MKIDDDARLFIYWDAVLTFDPAGSTVELKIGLTKYTMTWTGTAIEIGGSWKQTARTNSMFRGSLGGSTGSPVALTVGRHIGEPIVTLGLQVVPSSSLIPIDVE